MVGRDENGRFAPGNKASKNGGRKPRAEEDAIKRALEKAIPEAEILELLGACCRAKEPWAITLRLAYAWGKPRERVEISGADGEPLFDYAKAVQVLTGTAPGPDDGSARPGADYHDGDGEALG